MIRFATIGTNWITEAFIEAAKKTEDFALAAVYSRTDEKAKQFAAKTGAERTFTNLEELAKSKDIDAVYIASPNSLHAEQAILLMDHGKHVLCEKPMASNTKEVKAMIDAARRNGVVLMEAMKTTLLPNFQAVREHLHKIGKIRRYFASYCQYSSRYDAFKQGTVLNAFNPAFSNGALMDIGVYCIYPMVVLFGTPNRLQASSLKLESGVDGEGTIIFTYEDMDAVVMYSKITNSYLPAEIQGEDGSILIDAIHTPTKVEIRYRDGRTEDITVPQEQPPMYYEVKEFIELIKNGKRESEVNSHEHSLLTIALMEEARKQTGIVFPADQ
ncbi:Gfo/Idh/MocA family oxidoreductase [Parageobacillus thermoglucosidasius]|uniref:Gfo/Idh/MocA family protein n=1 Tax=Parageobacillus thermoglucosidasius TaxID=1426 RepID=UPI002E1BF266|nr:Gfo/Idh/MocA family oxidoreductase [Parageobacillus thermoglucosidasius]MED4914894.1 Gfo/Idh/MocA family oxidoreductase [Parageobacillus thermoglucosidasius]MED4943717.1 Gfo/Idh/MocA family oxidoreductase [Parageobacillus thermoglucosidasius]MED4984177.1 Gfo/Idh/MocA family oxidoreductase [Parageobacillus thermoglucosidasius]